MISLSEAEICGYKAQHSEQKLKLEMLSESQRKLSWVKLLESLVPYHLPQGFNAAFFLPSGSSMCGIKPPSLIHCCCWYVIEAHRRLVDRVFVDPALELLLQGVRLNSGLKPGLDLDIRWNKLPREVIMLVGVYKTISCYQAFLGMFIGIMGIAP